MKQCHHSSVPVVRDVALLVLVLVLVVVVVVVVGGSGARHR